MPKLDTILIQNGMVIDPANNIESLLDLLIVDGLIVALEKPGSIPIKPETRVIDAEKKWVLPGFIDVHVHLREPGFEYKETILTGTRAAVAGGFTSIACMANTNPVNDNPYVTSYIRERAKSVGLCRVFPIGAVSKGLAGQELAEIGGMVEEGAKAISDDGMPVMNSYLMRKAMNYARAFNVPVISHAEDAHLVGQGVMNEGSLSNELGLRGNPTAAEEIMVAREIALCRLTGCRVHIAHVSSALAIDLIKKAKEEGLPITAEVSPHHLFLDESFVRTYDTNFKMAPPLRTKRDAAALQKALKDGIIDMIATDHAPHSLLDKAVEFDCACNGIVGLESALSTTLELVHCGVLSKSQFAQTLTINPAKLLNIPFGTLSKNSQADVVIVDPNKEFVFSVEDIFSKSQNSPFLGKKLKGQVSLTIVGGKVVYDKESRHADT